MLEDHTSFSLKVSVNKTPYYLNRKIVKAPIADLYSFLSQAQEYPKIFWKEKNSDETRVALGSILTETEAPAFNLLEEAPLPKELLPRFWGGHAFANSLRKTSLFRHFPNSYFILPKIEIYQKGEETFIFYNSLSSKPSEVLPQYDSFKTIDFQESFPKLVQREDSIALSQWEKKIDKALQKIDRKDLKKVVLARKTTLSFSDTVDPFLLLEKLEKKQDNNTCFAFQLHPATAFIGATPELLYKRDGDRLMTEAIAGTFSPEVKEIDLASKEFREVDDVNKNIDLSLKTLCSSFNLMKV
mgnify:CR=1 FL=1